MPSFLGLMESGAYILPAVPPTCYTAAKEQSGFVLFFKIECGGRSAGFGDQPVSSSTLRNV